MQFLARDTIIAIQRDATERQTGALLVAEPGIRKSHAINIGAQSVSAEMLGKASNEAISDLVNDFTETVCWLGVDPHQDPQENVATGVLKRRLLVEPMHDESTFTLFLAYGENDVKMFSSVVQMEDDAHLSKKLFSGISSPDEFVDAVRTWASNTEPTSDFFRSAVALAAPAFEHFSLEERQRAVALGGIAAMRTQIALMEESADRFVAEARAADATWDEVGHAAGVTMGSAYRKWDPDARRKHTEYQRKRQANRSGQPPAD